MQVFNSSTTSEKKESLAFQRFFKGYRNRLIPVRHASIYLGLSKGYVYKLVSRGRIPFYQTADYRIVFLKNDLDGYLVKKLESKRIRYFSHLNINQQKNNRKQIIINNSRKG